MKELTFNLPIAEFYLQINTSNQGLFRSFHQWPQVEITNPNNCLGVISIQNFENDFSEQSDEPIVRWEGKICHYSCFGCEGIIEPEKTAILKINSQARFHDIEYFIRVVTAIRIFNLGGIMVHAAGIENDGFGFLFTGYSGAGKTTVCRVSEGQKILNDDLVILNSSDNGWNIYSTPFTNPTQVKPTSGKSPLHMILHLKQARIHQLTDVPNSKAIAELLTHCPVISMSSVLLPELISRCIKIIDHTRVKELHFLPDNGFWELLIGAT